MLTNYVSQSTYPEQQVILLSLAVLLSFTTADNLDRFCKGIANGRFTSSPRSCQHWLFCQNSRAQEGNCPGIFYFDEGMQMCRYPEFVQCNIASIDIPCPDHSDLVLLPHPESCEQYVACVNGFPRVMECAPGLQWDQIREKCDLPANVGCKIQVPEPELNYVCEPSTTYVTRHPNNCQQFIVCSNGVRRVNQCAESLLFDPVNLRCDFAANVNCVLPEATVDYNCDPSRDFYFAPHPNNCKYFIMCVRGNRQIERCASGLIFDWIHLQCNTASTAVCLAPPRTN